MKRLITVVLFWTTFLGSVCFGQQIVERTLPWHKNQPVNLKLKFGDDVQVTAWNKDQVYIKATVRINYDVLDSLFTMKTSNGDTLGITTDIRHIDLSGIYVNGCEPKHRMMSMDDQTNLCVEIHYTVYVPADVDLHLSSISANEIIRGLRGPVLAKSIGGFVDMDWPANRGAELAVKTISGEAYTNLDKIRWLNHKKEIPQVGYLLKGTLADGGPLIRLESIGGNIYLRAAR